MPSGKEYERFFRHFFTSKGRNRFACKACGGNEIKGISGAMRHMDEVHLHRTGRKKGKVHFDVILGNVEMDE